MSVFDGDFFHVYSLEQQTFTRKLHKLKGVFIATQLNSTDPVEQRTAKSVVFFVYDVTTYKLSQLGHYVH